jgi:hypothetical protein
MRTLICLSVLLALAAPVAAQESIVERVTKLEKRLNSLETKMDRVLDFLSANYGPNTSKAKAANCDCAVTGVCTCGSNCTCVNGRPAAANCANGSCAVSQGSAGAGACASGSCGAAGRIFHGGLLSRIIRRR